MEHLTEEDYSERRECIEAAGYVIDEGNLIAGPFISDGRVRIYCADTHNVVCEERTLKEAVYFFPTYLLDRSFR